MKTLTNDELIKVQGGGILTNAYHYFFKSFFKCVIKNLKILAN